MLEAFNKLLEQQKLFQNEMKSSATISKHPSYSVVDQTGSDPKHGTSQESHLYPNQQHYGQLCSHQMRSRNVLSSS